MLSVLKNSEKYMFGCLKPLKYQTELLLAPGIFMCAHGLLLVTLLVESDFTSMACWLY